MRGEAAEHALQLKSLAAVGQTLVSTSVQTAASSRFAFSPCTHMQPITVGGRRLGTFALRAVSPASNHSGSHVKKTYFPWGNNFMISRFCMRNAPDLILLLAKINQEVRAS